MCVPIVDERLRKEPVHFVAFIVPVELSVKDEIGQLWCSDTNDDVVLFKVYFRALNYSFL